MDRNTKLNIEQHIPYINKFCYNNKRYIFLYDSMDDFFQEMCLIAQNASHKYNRQQGKPTTFLTRCFINAIKNKIRYSPINKKGEIVFVSYDEMLECGKLANISGGHNLESCHFVRWAKEKLPPMVWEKIMGESVSKICEKYGIGRYEFQKTYRKSINNIKEKL